ncbi:MAG: dynein gamma chain protein [Raoultibacter sp.]
MCTNGINTGQYKMMLEQMDDQIALNRRWTHKLFHNADDSGFAATAATLKEIQGLLDEARALLTDAQDAVDKDASSTSGVTVNLV